MVASGEWCWGTSFYHKQITMDFFSFKCPTSFYNRPEIQNTIEKRKANRDTYDDSIVRQMVECIKVYHDGRLQIILGGGYELEEYLEK